jgi:hypothetical protein
MGLKREYAKIMRDAGFIDTELKMFGAAHKVDGSPMDIDKIFHSIPFQNELESRRVWWRDALKPKALGGKGLTREEAYQTLENWYKKKSTKGETGFWSFLKAEYRPPDRIKSRRAFDIAITSKSAITHSILGKYSTHIHRNPVSKMCRNCHGNGTVENIYHQQTTCLSCGGSGRMIERQRRFM